MKALENKVILVAGAGGIGGGLARRYAEDGASVVVGDIARDAAEDVAHDILEAGGNASAIHLDGADEDSVAAAVAHTIATYEGLDGLHANFATIADVPGKWDVVDLPLDIYDLTQNVNVRGYYLCTRAALPHILDWGGGSIVYTSSVAAYTGGPAQVAYAMSKAAGHALMRHVASRYGPLGVRANSIAPGMTMHSSLEDELDPVFLDSMRAKALIRSRFGRPEDIAAMASLLMSDAGSYVTGQIICVDGGMTMRS